MKTLPKFIVIIVVLIASGYMYANAQGYEIKIKFPQFKDSSVLLGHYFGAANKTYSDDTVKLDHQGMAIFKGAKHLIGGMYLIIFSQKKYFELLLDDNQFFSIEGDSSNFIRTNKFKGSPENSLYYEYLNQISDKGKLAQKLIERKKNAKTDQQKDSASKALDKINQEMVGYIAKVKSDHPQWFFTKWLNSLEEIHVPDFPRDANGKVIDSMFQARYYRQHYFDNFDVADARLLRTPFYEQKVTRYIETAIPPMPDTIIAEVDKLIEKVQGNEELFRNMTVTLFNYYAKSQIMGQDAVFVHIAEKWYIPNATWSSKDYMDKLKKEIAKKKPNLIGNIAPDINLIDVTTDHFMAAKVDTALKSNPYVGTPFKISDVKAKFLILAFWEADCGHCQKIIPALYDTIYPRVKDKDVKILAIHMISSVEGKRKWIDFVNEHHLYNWINAWSPYNLDYKDLYDVYATPTIYVLDENKKIIAKKISAEQAEEIINFELKKEKK